MNRSEVKYIEFVFENCEYLKINIDDVTLLSINDIKYGIKGNCSYFYDYYYSNDIEIILPRESNKVITSNFDITYDLFDRLLDNDITSIIVYYENKKSITIDVPYEEENPNILGSPNKLQNTIITPEGYLQLIIKDN